MISTKEAIQDAFIQLLMEREYTKISVSEITKKANINRGTFYLHYKEKDEVLEMIQERLLRELEQCVLHTKITFSLEKTKRYELLQYVQQLFAYIAEYKELFKTLLFGDNGVSFNNKLNDVISQWFYDGFFPHPLMDLKKEIPSYYLSKMAAASLVSIMKEWLFKDKQEPAELVAEYYVKMITYNSNAS